MSETTSITPTRPYMVRALYQWIEDNALTPYLMVDATADNVQIPTEHVQDGRIVAARGQYGGSKHGQNERQEDRCRESSFKRLTECSLGRLTHQRTEVTS